MAAGEHRRIVLGTIAGPHGTRGWVRIHSGTEPPENILRYAPWDIDRDGRRSRVTVRGRESAGARRDRAARRLPGPRRSAGGTGDAKSRWNVSQLPSLEEGEHYWTDLVGVAGRHHGRRRSRQGREDEETGANDVMVVRGEREPPRTGFPSALIVS